MFFVGNISKINGECMAIFLIVAFCLITALGALGGSFRRFSKVSLGGIIVLLSLAFERIIGGAVQKNTNGYGIIIIVVSVCLVLLFTLVFNLLRKFFKKAVDERKTMSHYQNSDEVAECEAYIMDALDKKDKKAYKAARKKLKKIKDKAGVWGILDVVFGGVEGALNAAVLSSCIIICFLMFVDLSSIGALTSICSTSLSSGVWKNFASSIVIDIALLGVLYVSIQAGYKSGLSSALCILVVLGITVCFGIGSWMIADTKCPGFVEKIQNGLLHGALSGNIGETVSKIIVALILFLMSLIVVVLIAIFLPKLVERLRKNKIFKAVDGVIGAIVACGLIFGIMLILGALAFNLFNGYDIAKPFEYYFNKAFFGSGLYDKSPVKGLFGGIGK